MWFDTHAHLDDDQLASQVQQVLSRAQAAGVTQMLAVGTTAETSHACVSLAERHSGVFAAVGIHPNYAHQATVDDWQAIEQLLQHPRVVAIGETGLDRYWDHCPFETQLEAFRRQIAWSIKCSKPFIVHQRDCESDVVAELVRGGELNQGRPLIGIMHSFCGSWPTAQAALDAGLYLSFAGMVTYPKNHELREIVKQVPSDRLLLETDCPYLSPHPFRSRRPNEPELMVHTARCVAEARGVTLRQLAEQTTANAERLLRTGQIAEKS